MTDLIMEFFYKMNGSFGSSEMKFLFLFSEGFCISQLEQTEFMAYVGFKPV